VCGFDRAGGTVFVLFVVFTRDGIPPVPCFARLALFEWTTERDFCP
jgi:hypothetical protein